MKRFLFSASFGAAFILAAHAQSTLPLSKPAQAAPHAPPAQSAAAKVQKLLSIGDPAPPIVASSWVQGDPIQSGPGEFRVVEFWATWCPPCRESIPHLTELAKKYKGQVEFVGVDISEQTPNPLPVVKAFVKEMGPKMAYKVAVDDAAGTMSKTWLDAAHLDTIPTAFILDKKGTILWIGNPLNGIDKALNQIVAGSYDLPRAKEAFEAQLQKSLAADKEQADEEAVEVEVKQAAADYKAGKKEAALAAFDKIQAPNPLIKQELGLFKFSLWYPDDRTAARAYAEQQISAEKNDPTNLIIQYAAIASMREGATPDDKTYAITLGERALKASAGNPATEYQVSLLYADAKQKDKAAGLMKEALSNLSKADPRIQGKLKEDIEASLTRIQSPDKPSPTPTTPAKPKG